MSIKLYRHPLSGHSHRVELFLSLLELDAELIDVDLMTGAHKAPEFVAKNIFGQVPLLEDGDVTIADANAILIYLANKYDVDNNWLPKGAEKQAEVQRFLSIAAGQVAYGPAAARLVTLFGAELDHQKTISISEQLLTTLETHLAGRSWLATSTPTIADIANYAYIAHAPEGGVTLQSYPNVKAWLKRIEELPGFVPMQSSAVGLAA